jgi:ABC-type nickel/cobalt efflux system permease component RcnA
MPWLTAALAAFCMLHFAFCIPHAHAHPIPRSEYDRNLTVTWRADGVHILYRLEIDEFTLLTTVGNPDSGFRLDPAKKRIGRKDIADAYIALMRKVIPDHVLCKVDGEPVAVLCTDARVEFLDSAQFRFRLRAAAPLQPGRHTLEVEDLNFIDKKGRLAMKFDADESLKAERVSEPPEGRLIDVKEAERRTLSAAATVKEWQPEYGPMPRVVASEESAPEAASPSEPTSFWELLRKVYEDENLTILLDSDVGLWMILLLAALHGVLHSVAPGHGKTMVAAYLIGEQGTPKHAIILGLIVTLTHTSAAFAVALLLKFALPMSAAPTVQSILGIGGGALVVFIGLWLLKQRLVGRTDHFHVGSHSHGHGHSHSHGDGHGHSHGLTPEQFATVSWPRLILLGISGGIVPCWGAILWVLYCVTAARYGLALWAVLAFSIGLASVLILIGLSVVWGGRLGGSAFRGRGWFRIVSKWLPIVGAALVIAIGVWLMRINLPK